MPKMKSICIAWCYNISVKPNSPVVKHFDPEINSMQLKFGQMTHKHIALQELNGRNSTF